MDQQPPRNAVLYARISDARGDGRSVNDQERDMRALAERLGWGVLEVLHEPDTSAFKRRVVTLPDGRRELRVVRPQFRRVIDMLTSGRADGLLVYDLDRAARDLRDLQDLIDVVEHWRPGTPVQSVTGSLRLSSDADVAMAQVMVTMANKASRDTSRRVKRAAKTRAENGGHHGGRRPFGYASDGLTTLPSEAAEVRKAADALLTGTSLRAVVADLRARDVKTVTGATWSPGAFRDVMLRPRNAGLSVHQGEVVGKGQWEPIYDDDTHRRVVALLTDPTRRTSPGNTVRWLGSGLYRCGVCGGTLRCTKSGGSGRPSYRCEPHAHVLRDAVQVDRHVVAALLNRLDEPGVLTALRQRRTGQAGPDPAEVARDIAALEQRLTGLQGALADPDAEDIAVLQSAMRSLRERIADREAELARVASDPVLDVFAGDVPDITTRWVALDLDRQRAILDLLATVTLNRSRRGRPVGWKRDQPYFDPSSIDITWKG